jgi:sugar-specific transcriptional regulator TrmB
MSAYQELVKEIDSIIRNFSKKSNDGYELDWENIDGDERRVLIGLSIEDDGKELVCISENENFREISEYFIRYFKRSAPIDLMSAAKVMGEYYHPRLKKLLEQRLNEVFVEDMIEAGLTSEVDDTGTTSWRKR